MTDVAFSHRGHRLHALGGSVLGPKVVRNQVAYEGEWFGHAAGEFELTRDIFEAVIRNFERREDPIPLTYGHPGPTEAAYMGAAGWIRALSIQTDDKGRVGLFADMEFTERAASQVKEGGHRHCSVVLAFESVDEVTGNPIGPELLEVGLVLSAFIDGMRPLAASRRNRSASIRKLSMDMTQILKQAAKDFGPDASPEDVAAYINAEVVKAKALEGEAGEESPSPDAEAEAGDEAPMGDAPQVEAEDAPQVAAGKDGEADQAALSFENADATTVEAMDGASPEDAAAQAAELLAQLGFPVDPAALLEMLAGAGEGEGESPDMSAMGLENKALKRKLDEATSELAEIKAGREAEREAAISKRVDDAIACKAFAADERDDLIALGKSAPKQFDTLIAKMTGEAPPANLPLSRKHQPSAPSETDRDAAPQDDDEREYIAALKRQGLSSSDITTRLSLYRDQVTRLNRKAAARG